MGKKPALIVSDSYSRRIFLINSFREAGMNAVPYSNQGVYLLHLEEVPPEVLVVDLTMPIANKLELIDKTLAMIPNLKVITIGQKSYLEQHNILTDNPNVTMYDSLQDL